jgi:hypothetical protein
MQLRCPLGHGTTPWETDQPARLFTHLWFGAGAGHHLSFADAFLRTVRAWAEDRGSGILLAHERRELRSLVVLGRQVKFEPPIAVPAGWYVTEVTDHGEALVMSLRELEPVG